MRFIIFFSLERKGVRSFSIIEIYRDKTVERMSFPVSIFRRKIDRRISNIDQGCFSDRRGRIRSKDDEIFGKALRIIERFLERANLSYKVLVPCFINDTYSHIDLNERKSDSIFESDITHQYHQFNENFA